VNDIIQAKTKKSQQLALNQLEGKLYKRIAKLLEKLSHYRIQLELEIDFLDDDVPDINLEELHQELLLFKADLEKLVISGEQGRIIREGLKISLIGKPNVGKSSLFNKLLESERAIVTPIPGTTRDYLEEVISLDGYLVRIFDTAGIRETSDTIEKLGIKRSKEIIDGSDFVLYITDSTDSNEEYNNFVSDIPAHKLLKVLNKVDIIPAEKLINYPDYIQTSTFNQEGTNKLKESLLTKITLSDSELNSGLLTNSRQILAVKEAITSIAQAADSIDADMGYEFTAFDLKEASAHLEEVVGKITNDDLLNTIFSNFCIGK